MSNRYDGGSHYENHQRAAEMHDIAAHAHLAAQQRGKGDHLTAHEHSRRAFEHSRAAHQYTQSTASNRNGLVGYTQDDIAALAYRFWQARGCPDGSAEDDWFKAVQQLTRLVT